MKNMLCTTTVKIETVVYVVIKVEYNNIFVGRQETYIDIATDEDEAWDIANVEADAEWPIYTQKERHFGQSHMWIRPEFVEIENSYSEYK